jgi:hypothetical protein
MLSCGRERTQFAVPLCLHLRTCRQPWFKSVKWYIGSGLNTEYICVPCAEAREKGLSVEAEPVSEQCFEYATTEVGDLVKAGARKSSGPRPCNFPGLHSYYAKLCNSVHVPKGRIRHYSCLRLALAILD